MNVLNQENIHRQDRLIILTGVINQQRIQIQNNIKNLLKNFHENNKYEKHRRQINNRIQHFQIYSKNLVESFFQMINNKFFLSLQTQKDIITKIDKFSKGLSHTIDKLSENIDFQYSDDPIKNYDEISDQSIRRKDNRSRSRMKKSKNSKIANQSLLEMNLWLLNNFDNPYPSYSQKQRMAKKGNLTLVQVNNWFINVRQRLIKKYIHKGNLQKKSK